MSCKALLLSAIASGQGKTTVTAALARKLSRAGQRVRVFKTGPDFIDPMLLAAASGSGVDVLDLWMCTEAQCHALLAEAARECDYLLIEGVMGLYDGQPSSADLARHFGVPVLAVLDCSAMVGTALAIARGLRDHGRLPWAGMLANRVASPGHADMIRACGTTELPVVGHLPRQAESLPERHLGLHLPSELPDLAARLDALADALHLDDAVLASLPAFAPAPQAQPALPPLLAGRRIAIARDAAFAFIYAANLRTLAAMGATLAFFSPLADEAIPAGADAVWLPGGYPELHADTLAANLGWQASLKHAVAADTPLWAECGGMMALTESLTDTDGHHHAMAGVLPGSVRMGKKLAALGSQAWPHAAGELRGHTFHYSSFDTPLEPLAHCQRKDGRSGGEAVYRHGSVQASYFHAYFASNPAAAAALFLPPCGAAPC
ncbi:hydrogenobyrinic acid a,c-diamide synthase (glutamine-hydrolysing) /cobyrinate a,c-diamide synthase [Vogesella indigofera]|uniref:Hydrogenobyrinic acid a,c-diamide synthase (Glutamine-hydrolysing) /cobyrinate a,c-diamide synthase n=1 Tax=Vogesella indigofera TaxID=45465 RepID=A0A495BIV1_VOGIN|nr:cobyrinate a,c-diamide synthase [Vogesella indigofera]RKQ60955.1 hydrogenobyrinic acid a,c-diamide synthase (glutamine-hydrolysing) /cobyrinate a,c-diamide synthase [Vogesella indigofera]